ncbi:MAG: GntR family transcriptional regulator [Actinobacteria bacterium]|jgi:DNA-binding GntR family transcriptional regulator|nr:GntR family transcriptional regulator [Actinomycetota bacterium]
MERSARDTAAPVIPLTSGAVGGRDDAPADDRGPSRIEWVHDQLRDRILTGDLAPGTVVSQAALARELGLSRAPIREALRRLEGEGLVESRHNQRVQIADLSISDMEEIYASRIAVETLAVRFTVPRLTKDDVAEMKRAWTAMRESAEQQDRSRWSVEHTRFHMVALSPVGPRLTAQIAQLDDHAGRYRALYMTQVNASWDSILTQDAAIIDAVESSDLDAVVDRWARHVASTVLSTIAVVDPTHDARLVRAALQNSLSAPSRDTAGSHTAARPGASEA